MPKEKPNLNYDSSMDEAKRTRQKMISDQTKALLPKYIVKTSKTSLSGEAEFVVPAGTYWLSNIEPSSIGRSMIFWDLQVIVKAGKIKSLELSNDNAEYAI